LTDSWLGAEDIGKRRQEITEEQAQKRQQLLDDMRWVLKDARGHRCDCQHAESIAA